jgi:hypothetical protein
LLTLALGPSIAPASLQTAAFAQEASQWKTFTPESNLFSALMPGKVEAETQDQPAVKGKLYNYLGGEQGKYGYGVGYMEFGADFYTELEKEMPSAKERDELLLKNFLTGFTESGEDFKDAKRTAITYKGYRGYDLMAKPSAKIAYGQVRVFMAGRRIVYLIILQGKEFDSAANRAKFINSFKFTPDGKASSD